MQVALTKKLADAMAVGSLPAGRDENPLLSWTANWICVWDNRRKEDMLVLVNNANRFTVAIYEFKRKDLKHAAEIMKAAIVNTLLASNYNPELVEDYMRQAGDVEFVKNSNRQTTAWVNKAGLECAFYVGSKYNGVDKMFSDTCGAPINRQLVNYSGNTKQAYVPGEAMLDALVALTGKPAYQYRAFELDITLDVHAYKAVRKIIVPADLTFTRLHHVLQRLYGWEDYHLYDFAIMGGSRRASRGKKGDCVARLVLSDEERAYDAEAILIEAHTLGEYLPEYKNILYTYDFGDCWEHWIRLVRVIEAHDQDSPYLLEASGQAPPEDVGGVGGFLDFCEIMDNPDHPDHEEISEWAGGWTRELPDWRKCPQLI